MNPSHQLATGVKASLIRSSNPFSCEKSEESEKQKNNRVNRNF